MQANIITFDAITTEFDAPVTYVDAYIQSEACVIGADGFDADQDLRDIVDDIFCSPPSASLGSFPTSRLTRQVKPKLAESPEDSHSYLDSVDVVRDGSFTRVGKKVDSIELIPGLLGTGKWRRPKGGITMDSGCSIDTVPTGHAPNVKMSPVPPERANRRIKAANGTRIKEHGVKQVRFRTREGQK